MIFYDLLFTTSQTLTDDSLLYKINELLDKECADKGKCRYRRPARAAFSATE